MSVGREKGDVGMEPDEDPGYSVEGTSHLKSLRCLRWIVLCQRGLENIVSRIKSPGWDLKKLHGRNCPIWRPLWQLSLNSKRRTGL